MKLINYEKLEYGHRLVVQISYFFFKTKEVVFVWNDGWWEMPKAVRPGVSVRLKLYDLLEEGRSGVTVRQQVLSNEKMRKENIRLVEKVYCSKEEK